MKKNSIKDIAKMAGVAPSTVSTILNGKQENRRISNALAQKVLAIAKKAGYTPNQLAVSLRTGSSKIIGLLVEDISNVFYASIASVIEDELKTHGYRVVYCSSKNDAANCKELIEMLSQRQVDGYIITPVEGIESSLIDLKERQKPVILIDRYFRDLDVSYVLVDDEKGINEGMCHLIQRGFKNIGLVTVDLGQIQMNYREKAFKDFCDVQRIEVCEEHILKIPFRLATDGMIGRIETFLRSAKDLDALFFTTNYLCIAGLQSLQKLNLRIPTDMAVLSFDDHELFRMYPPGITALRQPIEKIGQTAVSLLIEQLKSSNSSLLSKHQFIPGELIVRGSTGR